MFHHRCHTLLAVAGFACLWNSAAPAQQNDKQEPRAKQTVIEISKETTRITSPLDKDGYVDYLAAVNQMQSKGVTPRNNYEVVVRQVLPPDEIAESMREKYFAAIGLPAPKADAQFYRDFITHFRGRSTDQKLIDSLFDEHDAIMSKPWTAQDHPRAAQWVKEYGKELDKLVEGSKRPKNYTPYLAGEDDENDPSPRMIAVLLPSAQQQREIARGLSIRAMGRIGAGDLDGAWSDLQAMRRVGRHIANGFTLIESLVGIAIHSIAFQGEAEVLNSPRLTKAQAEKFFADLKAVPPLPAIAGRIDIGERFMGLDAVTMLAKNSDKHGLFKMIRMLNDLSDAADAQGKEIDTQYVVFQDEKPKANPPKRVTVDWNVTMRFMNKWYDRLVKACNETDFDKRKKLFEEFDADVKKLAANARNPQNLLAGIVAGKPGKTLGQGMGNILVALLMPAIHAARTAESQATARLDLMRIAFAAKLHRLETGSFPKSPGVLAPKHFKSLAQDAQSGRPFHYELDKGVVTIYGVGRNGIDDGGRTYDDAREAKGERPGWDDIVIKVRL